MTTSESDKAAKKLIHKYFYFVSFIYLLILSNENAVSKTYLYYQYEFTQDYYDYYYYVTHTRLAPYVIGMILGVYIIETENKKFKIHWALNLSIWLFMLGGMAAIIFTGNDIIYNYDRIKSTFYISLHRPLWAVALAWIVFACIKGYGGIVNWFLSVPAFQVLGRLTYSMYLLHTPFLVTLKGDLRTPSYYTDLRLIHEFFANTVFVTFAAILWVLAFESPMIILEKIIFSPWTAPKPKEDQNLNTITVETERV